MPKGPVATLLRRLWSERLTKDLSKSNQSFAACSLKTLVVLVNTAGIRESLRVLKISLASFVVFTKTAMSLDSIGLGSFWSSLME